MSSIQNLSKNETIRVYYKASDLANGLNVRFDFLKLGGSVVALNAPAAGEVPGRGIYYYDFNAPNEDVYVVGSAYVDDYVDVEPIIFKIGEPSQKCLFYYTEKNILGRLTYRIYNTLGTTVQDGDLTQIPSTNFWYVVFETTNEPSPNNNFFFEVDDTYHAAPFIAGVVSKTVDVFVVSSSLQNPFVSGEGIYSDTVKSCSIQVANPVVSASALVVVDVFEAAIATPPIVSPILQSITSEIVPPVVSGDALVVVNVFEASFASPPVIYSQPINATVVSPNVAADAVVAVSVFSVAASSQNNVVVGEFFAAEKQPISISLLQPTVSVTEIVEPGKPGQPGQGWPYDAQWSLGAAPGMPFGVVSGNRTPFITIQFKICGDNFPCEEGIYQKESGLRSSIKIGVENIKRKTKKSSVKIRGGSISRHRNSGSPTIEFFDLQKV